MRARIIRKEGVVSITPETYEDLWYLYKVITPGSLVSAHSTRKYKPGGSGKEERVNVHVTLDAEKCELHRHSNTVRITGKIVEIKPEEVAPLGAYHTIEVSVGNEVYIKKDWKDYELDMIKEAVESSRRDVVNIIVMDNEMATFAVLRQYGVDFGVELENKARKRDKEVDTGEFFNEIIGEMKKTEGTIVLGGPGFAKENLLKKVIREDPSLAKRIHLANASNAEKSGVYELIKSDELHSILEKENMHTVLRDVERFLKSVSVGDGMSAYGKRELEMAVENSAVDVLILLDSLVRGDEFYRGLLEKTRASGGRIRIVPEESQVAETIKSFGGAIALLRYRIRY